jgi:hypothetical protein
VPGVRHCRLGPEACLLLGEGLKVRMHAQSHFRACLEWRTVVEVCLDLSHCRLGPEACRLLGEGLKVRLRMQSDCRA